MSKNESRFIRKEILNCNDEVQTRLYEVNLKKREKNYLRLDCECVTKYYEVNEFNYHRFRTIIEDDNSIVDIYDEKNGNIDIICNPVSKKYIEMYGTYINLSGVSLISIIDFCDLMFEEIEEDEIIDDINKQILNNIMSIKV